MDNKPKTGYSGVCDDKGKSKNIIPGPLQNSAHYKYVWNVCVRQFFN